MIFTCVSSSNSIYHQSSATSAVTLSTLFFVRRLISTPCYVCKALTCSPAYNGLPPMKSLHRRTSDGMPSFFGNFSLMH